MSGWMIAGVEADLMKFIDEKRKVYIESGAANDAICGYRIVETPKDNEWGITGRRVVHFQTSHCIFPENVNLNDFENVDYEEYRDCIFVKVS